MTPAEEVARAKKPRVAYGSSSRPQENKVWKCELRAIRRTLALSMREVSAQCKISISALYRVECGGDLPLSTARRLAVFFGKPLGEIWPELIDLVKENTDAT